MLLSRLKCLVSRKGGGETFFNSSLNFLQVNSGLNKDLCFYIAWIFIRSLKSVSFWYWVIYELFLFRCLGCV
jgi:hypothetical protein